ncbi:hypothetical protein [Pararhizobium haloflavum]|uniref:hypothetical protein n=1 Tax=Pararhizobium haloflavum TaxID=2037914 RepID=UPI0012FFE43E|nr:hypothetical protein [Pararhizobium haloflavum]
MSSNKLEYKVPPPAPTSRRVYVLPVELVERIHAYGFDRGHPSEVSAVRELLECALKPLGYGGGDV